MKAIKYFIPISIVAFLLFFFGFSISKEDNIFLGPADIVASPDNAFLYIAEQDAKRVDIFDLSTRKIKKSIFLNDQAVKIKLWGKDLLVLTGVENGKLLIFNRLNPKKAKEIAVGHSPSDLVITDDYYIICNRFPGEISFVSRKDLKIIKKLSVGREPISMAILPGKNLLYVAHHLPEMAVNEPVVASKISIIDLGKIEVISTLLLPNGSNGVKNIMMSPDNKYAFVSHIIGRFHLPTTQLERGWMNTNALSVIDTENSRLWTSILLDDVDRGAANPWAIACSEDGSKIYVSHAGTHELSIIDWEKMKSDLTESETSLKHTENLGYIYKFRKRVPVKGNGPRSIALSGNNLITANYFSNDLSFIDLTSFKVQTVSLSTAEPSGIKRGEAYFHDAGLCFQNWQSCTSCHPDARVDGLNWDLLNDGVGNPKNTKSMLLSHETPPVMSLGVRSHAKLAVRAGFKYIQFADVSEEYSADVDSYLESLKPVASPFLDKPAEIEAGRLVFESQNCVKCHPKPYFTDLKSYNLGDDTVLKWDTPTLIEVWRTAPYWHDGKYATLKEVFEIEKHGIHRPVSESEILELEAYLLSL